MEVEAVKVKLLKPEVGVEKRFGGRTEGLSGSLLSDDTF